MCFENDYDWYAEVCNATEGPSDRQTRCDECNAEIAVGQWRKHIYMQEHEVCQVCEDWSSDEHIDREAMEAELLDGDAEWAAAQLKILGDHKCQFGETYDYDRCEACDKILRAIEAVEADEECPPYARQPALTELGEALVYDDGKYILRALEMFPEVAGCKMLHGRHAATEEDE